jgi:uncharacterized protein YbjT (DUF2867 family)
MIVVTGATGNVGGALVEQLGGSGLPVRGLTRDASRTGLLAGMEAAEGDLTRPDSLGAALKGAEALFLLAYGDVPGVLRAARKAGVQRVVLLSSSAAESWPDGAIGAAHRRAEEAVRDSGLRWTFLRPGQFAANALAWAPVIRQHGVVRTAFADVALPAIHEADIATVARAVLTGAGHDGRVYTLTGPEALTARQQVAELGAALGHELHYTEITPEQARQVMERHAPPAIVADLLAMMTNVTPDDARVLPTVEEVTGTPARTFGQWARDHIDAFRSP